MVPPALVIVTGPLNEVDWVLPLLCETPVTLALVSLTAKPAPALKLTAPIAPLCTTPVVPPSPWMLAAPVRVTLWLAPWVCETPMALPEPVMVKALSAVTLTAPLPFNCETPVTSEPEMVATSPKCAV